MKQLKKIVIITVVLLQSMIAYAAADLVIFSYNRPMQLYALLESIETYVVGVANAHVIYRADTSAYERAYQDVFANFPELQAHRQGANPHQDFKPLTLACTFQSSTEYVIFAVDDIIVKDFIDLADCVRLLNTYNAYGVYFRLGKNINYCYSENAPQPVPACSEVEPGVFVWNFKQCRYDWGYPNTVDMTLYRKFDIKQDLCHLHYTAPNTFEGSWAGQASRITKPKGIFFETTKIVNIPLNRVQNVWGNRHMNFLTPEKMLNMYDQGLKIDISTLYLIDHKAPHMEYEPKFIKRN